MASIGIVIVLGDQKTRMSFILSAMIALNSKFVILIFLYNITAVSLWTEKQTPMEEQ